MAEQARAHVGVYAIFTWLQSRLKVVPRPSAVSRSPDGGDSPCEYYEAYPKKDRQGAQELKTRPSMQELPSDGL